MTGLWQGLMSFAKGTIMHRGPGMITCVEFEEFILNYLDGSLPAAQKRKFDRHIRFCRECHDYLAAYQRTIEIEKAVFAKEEASVPADVPEDLVNAILAVRTNW